VGVGQLTPIFLYDSFYMAIVSLSDAKAHLRVLDTSEDALIVLYIDAASDNIQSYLNREIPVDNSGNVPASIKAACLLMVGDLFENREAQLTSGGIIENPAVKNLLYPHRKDIGI
jgi:uncharacterized phage protein (predicted DNA packaging)